MPETTGFGVVVDDPLMSLELSEDGRTITRKGPEDTEIWSTTLPDSIPGKCLPPFPMSLVETPLVLVCLEGNHAYLCLHGETGKPVRISWPDTKEVNIDDSAKGCSKG